MISLESVMIAPPGVGERFDPRRLFEPGTPVELEIGSGKGGFLIARANAHPDVGLLGIEWANKFYTYAADRMARRQIGNVRLMRTDAAHFVVHHLVPDCLSALHVYHPDPWPKKRHHKRRLFQKPFIDAAAAALLPGALWWIQTDHAGYFEWICDLMKDAGGLRQVPFETERGETPDPSTNYQVKYVREGRTLYRLAFQRER